MINAERALEKAPFYLIAALYLSVIAIGFGTDSPPLAPNSVLLVAATVVVLGHLLNAYQIATLIDEYPSRLFAIDFLLIGLLAWAFNVLAHPLTAGVGSFLPLPPPVSGDDFVTALSDTLAADPARVRSLVQKSFGRFFWLAAVVLPVLITWHLVAGRLRDRFFRLNHFWDVYVPGWGGFGLIIIWGLSLVCRAEAIPWNQWFAKLGILSEVAALAAVLFVAVAKITNATYRLRLIDLRSWLMQAFDNYGGSATLSQLCTALWKAHANELRVYGDKAYPWQKDVELLIEELVCSGLLARTSSDNAAWKVTSST